MKGTQNVSWYQRNGRWNPFAFLQEWEFLHPLPGNQIPPAESGSLYMHAYTGGAAAFRKQIHSALRILKSDFPDGDQLCEAVMTARAGVPNDFHSELRVPTNRKKL